MVRERGEGEGCEGTVRITKKRKWCGSTVFGSRIVLEMIGPMRLLTLGVGEWNPGLSMLGGTWPVCVGVDFFLFWSCIVFSLLSLLL